MGVSTQRRVEVETHGGLGLGGDGIVGYCGYVSRSKCGRIFSEVLNGCTVDFGIGLTLEGIFLYCLGW